MKNNSVSKIKVSSGEQKRNRFDWAHDVNTTYTWGDVQPLMNKMLMPDSTINVNMEQLVRLAPMVLPTFGRVKMKNVAHFVPVKEIFPNWDYFLSKTAISRPSSSGAPIQFIPNTIPNIKNNILANACLIGAKATIYVKRNSKNYPQGYKGGTMIRAAQYKSWDASLETEGLYNAATIIAEKVLHINNQPTNIDSINYNGPVIAYPILADKTGASIHNWTNVPFGCYINSDKNMPNRSINVGAGAVIGGSHFTTSDNTYNDDYVTPEGADMVWEFDMPSSKSGTIFAVLNNADWSTVQGAFAPNRDSIVIAFKLSDFGKRLRKILIASGYNVNLMDDSKVSILPLLAFYKAYFDTFEPTKYHNFYNTAAWDLIQYCINSNAHCELSNIFTNNTEATTMAPTFIKFIMELGSAFATDKIDIIAAANENITGIASGDESSFLDSDTALLSPGTLSLVQQRTSEVNAEPELAQNDTLLGISQQDIDILKKMYMYVNKYSVAGKNIKAILKAKGMGDYIDECDAKFINSSEMSIQISDVVATAQTDGRELGEYGGRGLGFDKSQFSYQTKEYGYFTILSTIVPEAGYTNTTDSTLEDITLEDIYMPDFDGVSVEQIQKKNVVGSIAWNSEDGNGGFGYLPTYTHMKWVGNVANGDFSLRSKRNSMLPYTLDKYIPVGEKIITPINHTSYNKVDGFSFNDGLNYNSLPTAGTEWRYINKYSWNGNYDRIFAADVNNDQFSDTDRVGNLNNTVGIFLNATEDNFMSHNIVNAQYFAKMKAIEDSYNTYDNEHDGGDTAITKA